MKTMVPGTGILKFVVALVFLAMAPLSGAAVITINASNSGWYTSGGSSNGNVNNTCTGCGTLRAWMGWDISSVQSDNITAVTLRIFNDPQNNVGNTIQTWDVTSPYATLGTDSLAIYNDLGSGTNYGSFVDVSGFNLAALNAAAVADLNAAVSTFAIGMSDTTGTPNFGFNAGVGTNPAFYQLIITTVPEPGVLSLLAFGLAGLGFGRRRKA